MLNRVLTLAALSVAASTPIFAQTATTVPVGFVTVQIAAGTPAAPVTTGFSVPMFDTPAAAGAAGGRIASLTSASITVTSAGWTAGALSNVATPYMVKFTTGTMSGALYSITANTADTLTVSSPDLTTLGIVSGASGDLVELVPVDTLNTLFGSSTFVGGANPTDADIVYVSSSSQLAYYYNTTLSRWVRTTGPTTDRGNTVILPSATIHVAHKGPALALTFLGRVPNTPFRVTVANSGNTYMHTGFPTDVTLGALALQSLLPGWVSAPTAAAADNLSVATSGGGYTTYFHNGTNWQRTTGPATNRDSIVVPATTPIVITKKGAAVGTADMSRPLPYSL